MLGYLFMAAYVVTFFRGRRALLYVVAAAVPFNDSAAVAFGGVALSPFYLGLIIYLAMEVATGVRHPSRRGDAPLGLLIGMLAFGLAITVVGPILFAGKGVIASGIGIDEQVERLTPLAATSSNFAQAAYLALNLAFVFYNERSRTVTSRHVSTAFAVGTVVAFAGFIAWRVGLALPKDLFDNSIRNHYAGNTVRLRAQFAEPSHLGAFALVATFYFGVKMFQARDMKAFAPRAALTLMAAVALVSSGSGTGVIGGIVAIAVVATLGITRALRARTLTLRPLPLLMGLTLFVAALAVSPALVGSVTDLVSGKQGGTSLNSRDYSNQLAVKLFTDTLGLGVGLGSNRASSLFFLLISTVGLIGTVLFLLIAFRAFRNGQRDHTRSAASIALVAFISAAFISYGDLASPVLWILVAYCFPATAHQIEPEADSPLEEVGVRSPTSSFGR